MYLVFLTSASLQDWNRSRFQNFQNTLLRNGLFSWQSSLFQQLYVLWRNFLSIANRSQKRQKFEFNSQHQKEFETLCIRNNLPLWSYTDLIEGLFFPPKGKLLRNLPHIHFRTSSSFHVHWNFSLFSLFLLNFLLRPSSAMFLFGKNGDSKKEIKPVFYFIKKITISVRLKTYQNQSENAYFKFFYRSNDLNTFKILVLDIFSKLFIPKNLRITKLRSKFKASALISICPSYETHQPRTIRDQLRAKIAQIGPISLWIHWVWLYIHVHSQVFGQSV